MFGKLSTARGSQYTGRNDIPGYATYQELAIHGWQFRGLRIISRVADHLGPIKSQLESNQESDHFYLLRAIRLPATNFDD